MSESNKESRVGSFRLSSSQLSADELQGGGEGGEQSSNDGKEKPATSQYKDIFQQSSQHRQRDSEPQLEMKREAQENYEGVATSAYKAVSDKRSGESYTF